MAVESAAYAKLGVSTSKEAVHDVVDQNDQSIFPGAFCKAWPSLSGNLGTCMLDHVDGAGTKAALAWLVYLTQIQPHTSAQVRTELAKSIFAGLAQDALVMNTDDLLCVGALGPFHVMNVVDRNRISRADADPILAAIIGGYHDFAAHIHNVTKEICGYQDAIHLRIGSGETADVSDLTPSLLLNVAMVTEMDRRDFINASKVKPGHVIVGLASDGQAVWEDRPNSGVRANGLTLLRHRLLHSDYRAYPDTFEARLGEKAYAGPCHLADGIPELNGMTVQDALLSPTRTYLPLMALIFRECRSQLSAVIHNTGGGQTKGLGFGKGVHYVKDDVPVSPFSQFVQRETQLPDEDMYPSFNMGWGMEIVCDPKAVATITSLAHAVGIKTHTLGRVESLPNRHGRKLSITTPRGQVLSYEAG